MNVFFYKSLNSELPTPNFETFCYKDFVCQLKLILNLAIGYALQSSAKRRVHVGSCVRDLGFLGVRVRNRVWYSSLPLAESEVLICRYWDRYGNSFHDLCPCPPISAVQWFLEILEWFVTDLNRSQILYCNYCYLIGQSIKGVTVILTFMLMKIVLVIKSIHDSSHQ